VNAKLKTIGDHSSHYWAFVITISPLILASILAATMYNTHVRTIVSKIPRILADKMLIQQHHTSDLYAGAVIGLLSGTISYRSVYAALLDSRYNHIPLPPFAAKTRFSYLKDGRTRLKDKYEEYVKEEVDKLVVWSWWKSGTVEQNREKELFWMRNIRTTQATGCESGFKSEPSLRQNEQDEITGERIGGRYNIASTGMLTMPQYSPTAQNFRRGGVEASGVCQV
jgi:diacylglycerol diphosphate phosphatase/phosphatidate phosphatase